MLELWFVVREMMTISHKFNLDSMWRGPLGQEWRKIPPTEGNYSFQWDQDPKDTYIFKNDQWLCMLQFWASTCCLTSLGFQKESAYSFFKNEPDLQNKHSKTEASKINNKYKKQNKKLCHRIWFSSIKKTQICQTKKSSSVFVLYKGKRNDVSVLHLFLI